MLLRNSHTLHNAWLWHHLARIEIVAHLPKYPRAAIGCTTNHHSINAIAVEHLSRLFARIDISVTNNWNVNQRIILDFAYQCPIGLTFVELATGATVNCKCRNTNILQAQSNLLDILRLIVPAEASFDGYGFVDSLDNLLGHLHHQWHITHHSRTCTSARNLLHRATEVYINNIGVSRFGNSCSLDHWLYLITINLNSHRTLEVVDIQLCTRFPGITNKAIRRDKLRRNHICAKSFTDIAERRVGNILHRCEEQGLFTKLNIANLHRCLYIWYELTIFCHTIYAVGAMHANGLRNDCANHIANTVFFCPSA